MKKKAKDEKRNHHAQWLTPGQLQTLIAQLNECLDIYVKALKSTQNEKG